MTYLRIERKRPRDSIQNQHEIVVSSTGDMKTAEATEVTVNVQVQIDFYCTTFQLHFQLILSEMKRERTNP